jgi:hypothetical protein
MKNYINDDSLFTVVNVPYSNTAYSFAIINWLATRGSASEYKQIYDPEAFKNNFTVAQYQDLYPGVKTIATVTNPWQRIFEIFITEISLSNSKVPNDFNLFVERLSTSSTIKIPSQLDHLQYLEKNEYVTADYILRVESIEIDIKSLQSFFINNHPLKRLPLYTSTAYISEYNDHSIQLVEKMFIDDINKFGYRWNV